MNTKEAYYSDIEHVAATFLVSNRDEIMQTITTHINEGVENILYAIHVGLDLSNKIATLAKDSFYDFLQYGIQDRIKNML